MGLVEFFYCPPCLKIPYRFRKDIFKNILISFDLPTHANHGGNAAEILRLKWAMLLDALHGWNGWRDRRRRGPPYGEHPF